MAAEPPVRANVAPAAMEDGPAILFEAVRVPAQVDQAQWLVRVADGSMVLLEQERWASPLADELREALREILVRRYGAVEGAGATGAEARAWRVRVDVSRFESTPGLARLEATWTLTPRKASAGPALRCVAHLEQAAANDSMNALAAAHREAVLRLGDAIGEQLLALQRGAAGRCPA